MNRSIHPPSRAILPCLCVGLVVLLWLSGCVSAPAASERASAHVEAVWPPPPDEPRLKFLFSLRGPADLGIEPTWWQRVASFFFGAEQDRLVKPSAVLDLGGTVYVADPGVQGVHRFDLTGKRHAIVRGPGRSALPSPVALAAGPGASVLVSDSSLGQVLVLQPEQDEARVMPLSEPPKQPTGIAYDDVARELFLVDTVQHCVLVYTDAGILVRKLGARGNGAGQFNYPTMLALSPSRDMLWVTDSLNFRLQAMTTHGVAVRSFGRAGDNSGDLPRPKGVALDRSGHVYVVDAMLPGMQIFDDKGTLLLALGGLGQEPGEFRLPMGIHISASNTIFVADTFNQRVQVFRYIGSP